MQNLSLLQILKLLSGGAVFSSDGKEEVPEPPMPENNAENRREDIAEKKAPPNSSVRAYEIFSSRHEQAVRRAQKREE